MIKSTTFAALASFLAIVINVHGVAIREEANVQGSPLVEYTRDLDHKNLAPALTERQEDALATSGVVLTCFLSTDCLGFSWPVNASFTANTPCIPAPSCNCMLVQIQSNANLHYWNGGDCSGSSSYQPGCFECGALQLKSPGTNSIGFHVGCVD